MDEPGRGVKITPYEDAGGKWRWRMKKGNNKNFAASGESFHRRHDAVRAAATLAAMIPGSVVTEPVPHPSRAPQ